MASQWIGVIRGAISETIFAVINPDEDAELDNPRLLLIRGSELEPVMLVRVLRDSYMACLSMDDVVRIVDHTMEHQ